MHATQKTIYRTKEKLWEDACISSKIQKQQILFNLEYIDTHQKISKITSPKKNSDPLIFQPEYAVSTVVKFYVNFPYMQHFQGHFLTSLKGLMPCKMQTKINPSTYCSYGVNKISACNWILGPPTRTTTTQMLMVSFCKIPFLSITQLCNEFHCWQWDWSRMS